MRPWLAAAACCLALTLGEIAARAQAAADPPTWITDQRGRRFRVRFDPGHRLFAGAGAAAEGGARPGPAAEVGLSLRAPPPPASAEVFWKRDHEIAHLRLQSASGGATLQGRPYQGIFLRHSREGSFTVPTTPPLRLALPFDVGVRVEVGRLLAPATPGGSPWSLQAGVVRGEAMADLLRSERPGRWITVGLAASYDVALAR